VRGGKERRDDAYSNDAGDENRAILDFCTRHAPLPIAEIFLIVIPTLSSIVSLRSSQWVLCHSALCGWGGVRGWYGLG